MAFDPTASRTSFDQALRAYRAGDRMAARRQIDALLARDPKDAVMFNSDLFHETGTLNFKDGYENRRINVTMLFGRRATG